MIVNFSVSNYRSFRDERTLDMQAASIREHRESLISAGKARLLPLAVLYGANSAGKSNLIEAIACMSDIIRRSVKMNDGDKLPYDPFALNEANRAKPTSFEMTFIANGIRYRYGFEYNADEIVTEWLYEKRTGEREYELFFRAGGEFAVSKTRFAEGLGKKEMTNPNRLFLSVVAQLRGGKAIAIMAWFRSCNVLSGIKSENYEAYSLRMFLDHLNGADDAQEFFRTLQLGFSCFSVRKADIPQSIMDEAPKELKARMEQDLASGDFVEPLTTHVIYDDEGRIVGERTFPKNKMESEGTKKVIEFSGPIFDTLKEGKVLIIDELDAKLHPLITRNIVLLFMDEETNPNGAQLIFATHDTNLLDLDIIRRDQIWFAEKDAVEATDLYSLVEFKDEKGDKVRNDRDVKSDYIRGRYGAIPFIGGKWDTQGKAK